MRRTNQERLASHTAESHRRSRAAVLDEASRGAMVNCTAFVDTLWARGFHCAVPRPRGGSPALRLPLCAGVVLVTRSAA